MASDVVAPSRSRSARARRRSPARRLTPAHGRVPISFAARGCGVRSPSPSAAIGRLARGTAPAALPRAPPPTTPAIDRPGVVVDRNRSVRRLGDVDGRPDVLVGTGSRWGSPLRGSIRRRPTERTPCIRLASAFHEPCSATSAGRDRPPLPLAPQETMRSVRWFAANGCAGATTRRPTSLPAAESGSGGGSVRYGPAVVASLTIRFQLAAFAVAEQIATVVGGVTVALARPASRSLLHSQPRAKTCGRCSIAKLSRARGARLPRCRLCAGPDLP